MSTWPATLPQLPLANSYRYSYPNNVIKTSMDVGPQKRRLRGTVAPKNVSFQMYITADVIADLDTFFIATTHYGVDSFTAPFPSAGTVMHFAEPPTKVPSAADWLVSFVMEIDP